MKKIISIALIILISSTLLYSCIQENQEQEITVLYDTQDNVIKIDDSQWIQSVLWNSYVDDNTWYPGNSELAIRHNVKENKLKVISLEHELIGIKENDVLTGFKIVDGEMFISMPNMWEYIDKNEVIEIKLIVKN